ncbi:MULTISPECIES: helix-turn-helix domain-containing protein [unclassified Pseudofrankia]|uniref:helix-turn-helix domain-containing protein n=1 Tax=unclassified Pseudofrankia TaxID=2994372 RepID=UPI001042682C|nr:MULTISPECIES: AraC family transcriptional regulator [unclassified Pseudofrankia]MDT3442939.1 AraC family transcriptional regulator [Pseudofrankia sp. BMG5.37]
MRKLSRPWVPGTLTVQSPEAGWDGISVRGYKYAGSDVPVPPMRDYMIVAYRRGATAMHRRFDSRWSYEDLAPGDVSLLTRASESHWRWPEPIEVVHLYLTQQAVSSVCGQVFDRDIGDVELRDLLKANDPAIHRTAMLIAAEAAAGGLGSRLLVESLSAQLIVHLIRRHADVTFRGRPTDGGLTCLQLRAVRDYVAAHIGESMSLAQLAACAALSPYHFARQFRVARGCSPHEFVLQQRVEHAQRLLSRSRMPIRDIALDCGFCDQSHMTRVFKRHLGVTPRQYRLAA